MILISCERRMSTNREHLFSDLDYHQVRDAFEKRVCESIDKLYPAILTGADSSEFIPRLVTEQRMDPPRLIESGIRTHVTEIEVSGLDAWGEPFRGPGVQIDFFVPFEGNPEFFRWKPSSFSYNRPTGVVHGQELLLRYRRADHDADAARRQFDADLGTIRSYLGTWANDANSFNLSIGSLAASRIETRRQKLARDQEFARKIGFPQK
jgi:hypothetical protein